MDQIDDLLKEHESLRLALREMSDVLGPARGTGWDDSVSLDAPRLCKMVRAFQSSLRAHEEVEGPWLREALKGLEGGGESFTRSIDEHHRLIDDVSRLLSTVIDGCDGQHVYKIRTVMARVTDRVEEHLRYEEEEVFPRLRAQTAGT